MTNVQEFINLLKNGNANERYEACLQLMKLSPIPAEALEALQVATKDEDAAVSSAAQKIINLQNAESISSNIEAKEVGIDPIQKAVQDALASHRIVSSVYAFLTAILLIMNCGGLFFGLAVVGWEAIIQIVLIPIIIVGSCIFVSKYFISSEQNIKLGNIILYSAPVLVWLYLIII